LDGTVKINFLDLNISNQIQRQLLIDEKRNSFAGSTTLKDSSKEIKKLKI
jgi:hypothetical protein